MLGEEEALKLTYLIYNTNGIIRSGEHVKMDRILQKGKWTIHYDKSNFLPKIYRKLILENKC